MKHILQREGLLPEWVEQDAVMIAWPHKNSDWASILNEIEKTYVELSLAILHYQKLVILLPEDKDISSFLPQNNPNLHIVRMETNDTWVRDYAPLSCIKQGRKVLVDYRFNGWGQKFASNYDNLVSRKLYRQGFFALDVEWVDRQDFVFEGGAIESNGVGDLLSTEYCLLEENRNSTYSRETLCADLKKELGAETVLLLTEGAIEGDDTDGHIDTLARFVDEQTIAYVAPTDRNSYNYTYLQAMERELQELRQSDGITPYRLVALPDAGSFFDEEGEPMPATYANFLFVNGALLLPTYGVPQDEEAIQILKEALPDREIVGVNCYNLIRQHGSLHCATMQFPKGFLNPELLG